MKVAQNFGAHKAHNVEMISHVDTSWAFDVVVAGNFAYVADDYVGLQVVDISAINELSNRISYGIGQLPNISTSKAPGLAVINGSVSGKPYAGKGTKGYRVVVRDNLAYVAGWGGMQIVDISDPTSPKEMSFHRTPHYAFDIAIAKNYAYIANGFDGLRIVDISDPTAPVEINAYIPEEGYIKGVEVIDNYVYVANASTGLSVLDASDITHLAEMSSYAVPLMAWDVKIVNGYAFVIWNLREASDCQPRDCRSGVSVVDISTITNLALVGIYCDPGDGVSDVEVVDKYMYVAAGHRGVLVLDISVPMQPTEVGFYDTPGDACNLAVNGSHIYVADADGGLLILQFIPE
jgi:hypothetical protein